MKLSQKILNNLKNFFLTYYVSRIYSRFISHVINHRYNLSYCFFLNIFIIKFTFQIRKTKHSKMSFYFWQCWKIQKWIYIWLWHKKFFIFFLTLIIHILIIFYNTKGPKNIHILKYYWISLMKRKQQIYYKIT